VPKAGHTDQPAHLDTTRPFSELAKDLIARLTLQEKVKVGPIVKTTDWPKEMKPYSASQPGVLWA
jgi:hypothetical protein